MISRYLRQRSKTMTLRQEIEKILANLAVGRINYTQARNDLCEAIGKTAEGMPESEFTTELPKTNQQLIRKIAQSDYKIECQAYWQNQLNKEG